MRALIDSDVLIDHLQGHPGAEAELGRYVECCISLISWMEVMVGVGNDPAKEKTWREFLGTFQIVPVSNDVAERTVRIRREYRLKLPDAIIWASAQEERCVLVTRNSKDFPAGDPSVRFPYQN